MLTLTIRDQEHFDNDTNRFVEGPAIVTLELEHSLFSLAQWESKWKKPFLDSPDKTSDQTIDYVKIMTLTPDVSEETFGMLGQTHYDAIGEYINTQHTATWFSTPTSASSGSAKKETITAEIIYCWMISLNIPQEYQHWNLSRLLTLIRVANEKNTPEKNRKKMSRSDMIAQRRSLNEQRKQQMKSRG